MASLLAFSLFMVYPGASSADVAEILLQLKSPRTLERLCALTEVTQFSDPRLTSSVLTALVDADENVRLGAVAALQALPAEQRVQNKLEKRVLADESPRVRAKIACVLVRTYPDSASRSLLQWVAREIKRGRDVTTALEFPLGPRRQGDAALSDDLDCRIPENADDELGIIMGLLIQSSEKHNAGQLQDYLHDNSPQIRRIAAEVATLSGAYLSDGAISLAIAKKDLAIIAGAHKQILRQGESASIPLLVNALRQFGTPAMASHYLSSGQPQLVSAAQQWAAERGYRSYEVSERSSLKWGKGGRQNESF